MAAARTPNPAKAWREPEAFHSAALKCCQELAGLSSQLECGGEVGSRRSGAGATTSSVRFGGHFAVRRRAKQVRRPPQSRLSRTHPRNPLPTTHAADLDLTPELFLFASPPGVQVGRRVSGELGKEEAEVGGAGVPLARSVERGGEGSAN